MAFNNALQMYVVNDTGQPVTLAFSHQYSGYAAVGMQSPGLVLPGAVAGPLVVGFFTGVGQVGLDYWFCAGITQGGDVYATEGAPHAPTKECMCQSADDGMIYYFPFSFSSFVMPLISGPCSTGVSLVQSGGGKL